MPSARPGRGGVLFDVHVIASAREASVKCVGGVLKVKTPASPEKGKANKAVLQALKPFFGRCEIVAGATARDKVVLAGEMGLEAVEGALRRLAGEGARGGPI